jgi:hypothetical protein
VGPAELDPGGENVTVRKWFIAAALAFGVALPATAAEKKTEYTFGTLRTAPAADARAQAEKWLQTTGNMDPTAFDKLWASEDLSVFDRVVETLKLGSPEAAKLLAEAKNADKSAPKEVPALFKDEKQNTFFRANLALSYAKALCSARVYEEALGTLKTVAPEQVVDPSAYLFHKAVAEHGLTKKKEAISSIIRLLDDVMDAPDRYKMLATIMFIDMQGWKAEDKDLGNIAKLMDNSERRLGLGRGGPETQEIQKKIVFRLDELIKEKENQAKGGS